MTGIDYPTIEIGGRTLVVRYTLAAQVLMKRRGVDPLKIGTAIYPIVDRTGEVPTIVENPEGARNTLIAFSAMVAENFLDPASVRVNMDEAPSADYWAFQVGERLPEVWKAVHDCLSKTSEARRKNLQVAAPPQTLAS